jgi:CheY-like chemotaxis protein
MIDEDMRALQGRRLLVVEDEYIVATDLAQRLEDAGAEVVGPVASVPDALDLVEAQGTRLDGAVLDVNLGGEQVYPVADALIDRGVPFVLATGYDASAISPAYANAPRCEKPIDPRSLVRALAKCVLCPE